MKAFFIFLLVFCGCTKSEDQNTLARVNGEIISADDFKTRFQEYRFDSKEELRVSPEVMDFKKRVLNDLIEEKLLVLEAAKRKFEISPNELTEATKILQADYTDHNFEEMLSSKRISRSRLRDRLRTELLLKKMKADVTRIVPRPTEAEIETYYQQHLEQFIVPETFHVTQIVVKSADEGNKMIEELKKGIPFEELAQKHSFGPEAASGGDLGFLPKGSLPMALEQVVFKLPLDKPSPVIETEYGFHVIRVLEKKPAMQLSKAQARPEIAQRLTDRLRKEKYAAWLRDVLAKSKVERNHALLASLR